MVGIDGASAANQTWLRCDVFEMRFITQSSRLDEREFAIVDRAGSCVALLKRGRGGAVMDRGLG